MDKARLAGALWFLAALLAVAITAIFRTDTVQWVVAIAAAVAAAVVGALLLSRPNAALFAWSNAAGVMWLVVYAGLVIQQRGELVAWATDVFLGLLGLVAAILAYRSAKVAGQGTEAGMRAAR